MKCPNCGADNDASNRFCEQCGTDLSAVSASAAVATAAPAAVTTCPNCGEPVLPGQAFCDECGTTLPATSVAPAMAATSGDDAATVFASGAANGSGQNNGGSSTPASLVCTVCGHQNLPGDRFCDNCGADLTAPPASAASTSGSQASALLDSESPTIIDDSAAPQATIPDMPPGPDNSPPAQPPEQPIGEPPSTPPPPREEPPQPSIPEQDPTPDSPPVGDPPVPESEPIQMQTPAADSDALLGELLNPTATATPEPVASAADPNEAARARLQDVISRQQQIISQLEPVETALGDATPQGVQDSLQQARTALADAQAELDALQTPAEPAVDPAEVARLEEAISRQQQIISQLEPVETALGDATPQGVQDSLQQARAALADALAELATLTGTASAPDVSAPDAAPAADADTAQANQDAMDQAAAPAATPQPRLVVEDGGAELPFPPNKYEIIIGREDPISGVYPEVDLTPYGGESGGVSRQHARMNLAGDQWTIVDLNSTNYTRVDGTKIEPNTPTPVQDGSRVQLGRVAMTFRMG